MRIAVVGSGISGLTAAHLLDVQHEVVLYEAQERLGGHTCTVPVSVGDETFGVDVGFIVFNDRTYPGFIKLLDRLGVASDETEMSFSLSCEKTGLEYDASSLSGLLAQPSNVLRPSFYRMWADALRFYREARDLLHEDEHGDASKATLGEYLSARRFGEDFVERHLLPMGAAIWSTDVERMKSFPLSTLLHFFENHGLLNLRDRPHWRVVRGGSTRYVKAIEAGFRGQIRTSTPVLAVRRSAHNVSVLTACGEDSFDHVVLASHAGQSLRMLEAPTDAERAVLGRIRTQPNELVLHTDASVMPRAKRAWASWNYRLAADEKGSVSLTYHMNRLQHIETPVELCATLNPCHEIPPEHVLRRFQFSHPVFDHEALAAQAERDAICGVDRVHYVGAWWRYGFHEDGVQSALHVTRRFGVDL